MKGRVKMENKMIFDLLEGDKIVSLAFRQIRRGGGGEGFGDGIVIHSREKLLVESLSIAKYIKKKLDGSESSDRGILLCGGGMYETLILTVASSILSCRLFLTDKLPTESYGCGVIVAESPTADGFSLSISFDELGSLVLGELSSLEDFDWEYSQNSLCELCFLGRSGLEIYSEDKALDLAREYKSALKISPLSTLFSTLPAYTKEGFFGGLLCPLLFARKWVLTRPTAALFEQIKLTSPSVLLCEGETQDAIAAEMEKLRRAPRLWQRGKGTHPLKVKFDKLFPKTRAALRRLKMIYVHYHFGGKLKRIATLGEGEVGAVESLHSFGVTSTSILTVDLCGFVGFRVSGDRECLWRLPKGLFADMCSVGQSGVGKLTFYGKDLALGSSSGHTFESGSFRSEFFEELILVSDLYGFPAQKGVFYVKK